MPLIVMCGIPSSGKSTRARHLRDFIDSVQNKNVHIVCENDIIQASKQDKNIVFNDPTKEKAIRGQIMSEATRLIGTDDVVIVDAANYIKGYRYELYCMSKANKSTQCTVMCAATQEIAWDWNVKQKKKDQYSRAVFSNLVFRFEEPVASNRWENPLFVVNPRDDSPLLEVCDALFECKPPVPNLSTQCPPLASGSYLYEMDKMTQGIIASIQAAQKLDLEGAINIPGYSQRVILTPGSKVSAAQLAKIRRQFLSYQKLHLGTELSKIGPLFIQYLNANLP